MIYTSLVVLLYVLYIVACITSSLYYDSFLILPTKGGGFRLVHWHCTSAHYITLCRIERAHLLMPYPRATGPFLVLFKPYRLST